MECEFLFFEFFFSGGCRNLLVLRHVLIVAFIICDSPCSAQDDAFGFAFRLFILSLFLLVPFL